MIWGCPQKLFYSYMAKTCAFRCLDNLARLGLSRGWGITSPSKIEHPRAERQNPNSPRKWQLESSLHLFGAIVKLPRPLATATLDATHRSRPATTAPSGLVLVCFVGGFTKNFCWEILKILPPSRNPIPDSVMV